MTSNLYGGSVSSPCLETESKAIPANMISSSSSIVQILFPRAINAIERRDAFQPSHTFENMVTHLSPKLHVIGNLLNQMRVILVQAYTTAQVRGDLNTQGFKEVHRKFDRWLEAIVYEAGTIQFHLGLDADAKRKAVGDIGDADAKDRKSTRLNSSHSTLSRMPSSA